MYLRYSNYLKLNLNEDYSYSYVSNKIVRTASTQSKYSSLNIIYSIPMSIKIQILNHLVKGHK